MNAKRMQNNRRLGLAAGNDFMNDRMDDGGSDDDAFDGPALNNVFAGGPEPMDDDELDRYMLNNNDTSMGLGSSNHGG